MLIDVRHIPIEYRRNFSTSFCHVDDNLGAMSVQFLLFNFPLGASTLMFR